MDITMGDARLIIVETIIGLKKGEIPVERGMAIAANMKVLNDNILMEIKAARMSIEAEAQGKNFGKMMKMGKLPIGGEVQLIEG